MVDGEGTEGSDGSDYDRVKKWRGICSHLGQYLLRSLKMRRIHSSRIVDCAVLSRVFTCTACISLVP